MIHWSLGDLSSAPFAGSETVPPRLLSALEQELIPSGCAKRRREWLLGRWVAKRLVRDHVLCKTGRLVALDAVSVLRSPDGVPTVELSPADLAEAGPASLSLSHSHDVAMAALTDLRGVQVGADLERIAPLSEAFVTDYFTAEESGQVRAAARDERDFVVTALWSAKEAVLKALGLGLSVDPRRIGCLLSPREATHAWSCFAVHAHGLAGRLPGSAPGDDSPELRGFWRRQGDFVLTLAAWDRRSAPHSGIAAA